MPGDNLNIREMVAQNLAKEFHNVMVESCKPILGDLAECWYLFMPAGTYHFGVKDSDGSNKQ